MDLCKNIYKGIRSFTSHLWIKKKAFDSVNRNALWAVLRKSGVNGKLYRALKGIYASVPACVRDKCSYTKYFECL